MTSSPNSINSLGNAYDQPFLNLRALYDTPSSLVEGSMWGGWWGLSAYYASSSVRELFKTCTAQHPQNERMGKIGSAFKTAYIDLLTLGSSTFYLAKWAGDAKVIVLGGYLHLVKNLCFVTTVLVNGTEGAVDAYNVWVEKGAILSSKSPFEEERHKQLLCHSLIRLIGNTCMVAWALLGVAAVTGVSGITCLSMPLLTIGGVLGGAAFFYKLQIPKGIGEV